MKLSQRSAGPPPEHGWVCFHCGACLETEAEAEKHFGPDKFPFPPPACQRPDVQRIMMGSFQLLEAARRLKACEDRWIEIGGDEALKELYAAIAECGGDEKS